MSHLKPPNFFGKFQLEVGDFSVAHLLETSGHSRIATLMSLDMEVEAGCVSTFLATRLALMQAATLRST